MGRYNRNSKSKAKMLRAGVNPTLSILTINISDELLDMLELGKSRGWWCSRSEGIRVALGRGLSIILDEREAINQKIIEQLYPRDKLDPNKIYVQIPGRGFIEIIGEA